MTHKEFCYINYFQVHSTIVQFILLNWRFLLFLSKIFVDDTRLFATTLRTEPEIKDFDLKLI